MKKTSIFSFYNAIDLPTEQKWAVYSLLRNNIAGEPFKGIEDRLDIQLESILERKYRDVN